MLLFEERLITSLLAAVGCCLSSALLFFSDIIPSNLMVLGLIWALVCPSLDAAFTLVFALRSIIGACVGSCLGWLCICLAEAMLSEEAVHQDQIATLVAFPCSLVLGLAEESLGTPLSFFVRQDVARFALYAVASFGAEPLSLTLAFIFGSSIGYFVTLIAVLVIPSAGCVSQMERALSGFSFSATNVFECLAAFLMAGPDHRLEAKRRLDGLSRALSEVEKAKLALDSASWQPPSTGLVDLIDTLTLMPSQLIAVTRTLDERYSDQVVERIWVPLAPTIGELASTVSMTLREGGVEHALIPSISDRLYKQLMGLLANLEVFPAELTRFVFAIIAVIRFARLANRFALLRKGWVNQNPVFSFAHVWTRTFAAVKSLFIGTAWRSALQADLHFPLKIALIDQSVVQSLILWRDTVATGPGKNALWGAVTPFFCLLPTFGGSVVKSTRRVMGTAIGGILALLTVFLTDPQDVTALVLQLFLVGFISKWLSLTSTLGYGALMIFDTWVIVALASFDSKNTETKEIELTVTRFTMTVVGSVVTAILSGLVFPKLGMRKNLTSVCSIISTCSELFASGVESLLSERSIVDAASSIPGAELVSQYNAAAGFDANKRLRVNETARIAVRADSDAETKFFAIFRLKRTQKLRRAAYLIKNIEKQLQDIENAAFVFFATASGTLFETSVRDYLLTQEVRIMWKTLMITISQTASSIELFLNGQTQVPPITCEFNLAIPHLEPSRLDWALHGGLPRLYALFFTAEQFIISWNNLIEKLSNQH